MYHFFHRHRPLQLLLHGGDAFLKDPARNDPVEVRQVRAHIEGESVHGHPFAGLDADCADFVVPNPDTGIFLDPGSADVKPVKHTDHH